jgi:hypothetical protein
MLRVMMLGLRGLPDVQGGVKAHAEHLCPLLRELACDVEVMLAPPMSRTIEAKNGRAFTTCGSGHPNPELLRR